MIRCCKECAARTLGCHDKCSTYQKEKAEIRRIKDIQRKDSEITNSLRSIKHGH